MPVYNESVPGLVRSLSLAIVLLFSGICLGQSPGFEIPQKPFVPNNRWAMVIGASNYSEKVGALKYTAKEAREFAGLLEKDLDFDPANMRVLTDGGSAAEAPTSANVFKALDTLLADKRLDKSNLFVFYFSGHGMGTPEGDYLLPSDTVPGRETEMGVPVKDVIRRIVDAGLKNVLVLADACRAGEKNEFGSELNALCQRANIAVILGCSPGKRSYEYERLKRGAFTHFLMQALRDKDLRDASGAVWASKVGEAVRERVKAYTEPDHGKYAQVPSVWAEQSTLDVMMAVYPRITEPQAGLEQFNASSQRLDKRSYANACIAYADRLWDERRFDLVVQVLNTVDQLGESTPCSLYGWGVALDAMGRDNEAERAFTKLRALGGDFFSDLATVTSRSRKVSTQQRLASASRLMKATPNWTIRFLCYASVKSWGMYAQQLAFAQELLRTPMMSSRQAAFSQGEVAAARGKWEQALQFFDKSTKAAQGIPSDEVIHWTELAPTLALNKKASTDAWINRGLSNPQTRTLTLIFKARVAKEAGDSKLQLDSLRTALATMDDSSALLIAASVAGGRLIELKDAFKEAAKRDPYSWDSYFVLYLIATLEGDADAAKQAAENWDKYMKDELTVAFSVRSFLKTYFTDLVLARQMTPVDYTKRVTSLFLELLPYCKQFGYEADLWLALIDYGMTGGRSAQVNAMLGTYLKFTPATVPTDLRPLLFLVDLNSKTGPGATRYWNAQAFAPQERNDPAWIWAAYQASSGNWQDATKKIKGQPLPSRELQPMAKGLEVYLAAKSGRFAAARKLMAKTDHVACLAFYGLAYAAMGDWKKAEPLLRRQIDEPMWAYLFVQKRAVKELDDYYLRTKQLDRHRDLIYATSFAQPGNPLFADLGYGAKPGVAQYAGTIKMPGGMRLDSGDTYPLDIALTISASGACVGKLTDESKAFATVSGQVDAYGNLRAVAEFPGKRYRISAKIAPPSLYPKFAKFASQGQYFELVGEDGVQLQVFGWTEKK